MPAARAVLDMRWRSVGFPLVLLGALTAGVFAHAPAAVVDHALAAVSQDKIRLHHTAGTFWQGAGVLMFRGAGGEYAPALAVDWRVSLNPARMTLQMDIAERVHPMLRVKLGWNGVELQVLHALVPVPLVAAAIEHPAARFGWQGTILLKPGQLNCDWVGLCEGILRLEWHQVSTDFLPQLVLGDYRFDVGIAPEAQRLSVSTLQGLVALEGSGVVAPHTGVRLDMIASGPPELMGRMPDMFHGHAQPTGQPGRVRLVFN